MTTTTSVVYQRRLERRREEGTIGSTRSISQGFASGRTTTITTTTTRPKVPFYSWSDIQVDTVLGEGGFCYVFKAAVLTGGSGGSTSRSVSGMAARHDPPQKSFFALKTLKSKIPPKSNRVRQRGNTIERDPMTAAAKDLAMEAALLSTLGPHENIIRIHGISSLSLAEAQNKNGMGYFILLDILTETLRDRLNHWRRKLQQQHIEEEGLSIDGRSSSSSALIKTTSMVRNALKQTKSSANMSLDTKEKMVERIQSVALQVARGMSYLHQHDIVMRDLKPDNVGFYYDAVQKRECVKLFDFGMARQLKRRTTSYVTDSHDTTTSVQSRTTIASQRRQHRLVPVEPQFVGQVAGSFRYMPPETMSGKGTWLRSDVYSFGILLWEICTLSLPYEDDIHRVLNDHKNPRALCMSNQEALRKLVVREQHRPSMAEHLYLSSSSGIQRLLPQCWSPSVTQRPSFPRIIKRLIEVTLEDSFPSAASISAPRISHYSVIHHRTHGVPNQQRRHRPLASSSSSSSRGARDPPASISSVSVAREYHNLLLAKARSNSLHPKDTRSNNNNNNQEDYSTSKHSTSTKDTVSSHSANRSRSTHASSTTSTSSARRARDPEGVKATPRQPIRSHGGEPRSDAILGTHITSTTRRLTRDANPIRWPKQPPKERSFDIGRFGNVLSANGIPVRTTFVGRV
jgi:serine/threonine protein kinase